ncbi:radical SAM protein [Gordonia oryzae]|uniref:Radical SAM protein n=1 Tax=Gordonia oryzae TaxID=2487349 RepID=A0A3N4GU44_9ACTN|nr:radical SAM protein [Gordonia oryzae]RPA65845.1 radical SAM protein [Gordonia oryzae]
MTPLLQRHISSREHAVNIERPDSGEAARWIELWRGDALASRLRISLTAQCNFGCFFCHNEGQSTGSSVLQRNLGIDDYMRVVFAAADSGITDIKLTGGEPLLYRDGTRGIVELVDQLSKVRDSYPINISMTTNGSLLRRYARDLKSAGLDRVTLSIHSLSEAGFTAFIGKTVSSRYQSPEAALAILREVKFTQTKINTVVFGSESAGSLSELRDIDQLSRQYNVVDHRLYTIIDSERNGVSDEWVRYWNDGRLPMEVSRALSLNTQDSQIFCDSVEEYIGTRSPDLLPRSILRLKIGGASYSIEAMKPGRFVSQGLSDEGPYALRLAADGTLRSFLPPVERDPAPTENLTSSTGVLASAEVLRRCFDTARATLAKS